MRTLACVVLAACALPALAAGPVKELPPGNSAAASAAVMLSLDDYFSGYFGFGKVYVQDHPAVPPALNRAGQHEVEVISEADLKKRFDGKEVAPAFAWVEVQPAVEKGELYYHVSVKYTGLPTRGAKSIPLGGAKVYKYSIQGAKVELVESGVIRF